MFIFLYHAGKTSAYSFIRSFCAELYKSGFLSSNLKTSVAAADLDPGSGAFWNPGSELGVFRIPDPTITNDSVGKIFLGLKPVLRIRNYYFGSGSYLEGHFGSGSGSCTRISSDPDPWLKCLWNFRILKSECTFKGHFCAEIELLMLNLLFLSLQLFFKRPDP